MCRYCFECVNKATNERKCIVCGGHRPAPVGKMIYCELCPRAYHHDCYIPPMNKVPRGKWYCHGCISKAPPPKKRGPKKGHTKEPKEPKEPKESKNNTSIQSANNSTASSVPASPAPITVSTTLPETPSSTAEVLNTTHEANIQASDAITSTPISTPVSMYETPQPSR